MEYYPHLEKYLDRQDDKYLRWLRLGLAVWEIEALLSTGSSLETIQARIEERQSSLPEEVRNEVEVLIDQAA
ncbi:hypothetical protein K9M41_03925 [Candidatus Gracilibacteria bacterium]|nr:hypothetical protein [Candidatus Gracilibacteria bacterium]